MNRICIRLLALTLIASSIAHAMDSNDDYSIQAAIGLTSLEKKFPYGDTLTTLKELIAQCEQDQSHPLYKTMVYILTGRGLREKGYLGTHLALAKEYTQALFITYEKAKETFHALLLGTAKATDSTLFENHLTRRSPTKENLALRTRSPKSPIRRNLSGSLSPNPRSPLSNSQENLPTPPATKTEEIATQVTIPEESAISVSSPRKNLTSNSSLYPAPYSSAINADFDMFGYPV